MQEEAKRERSDLELADETRLQKSSASRSLLPTAAVRRRLVRLYVFIPLVFLSVALFGGMRFSLADGSFIFLKPPLLCLVFAAMLMILVARARLLRIDGWFSESAPVLTKLANGIVLAALFFATTQIFNSLIPEQGLPYWIVAFCFFWTLWNNIFAEFDTRRLFRSLGALFALAFVVKYLVLANLVASENQSWLSGVFESPSKAAATWLLDLPRLSPSTGYLQFFVLMGYMLGLYLLPSVPPISEAATESPSHVT